MLNPFGFFLCILSLFIFWTLLMKILAPPLRLTKNSLFDFACHSKCWVGNWICWCRTNKEHGDSVEDRGEKSSIIKCIPRSIKASLNKQQARSESMKSPLSEGPRISSDGIGSSRTITSDTSCGGSKRITEPSDKRHSDRIDSFREEKDNVIKIEES